VWPKEPSGTTGYKGYNRWKSRYSREEGYLGNVSDDVPISAIGVGLPQTVFLEDTIIRQTAGQKSYNTRTLCSSPL